MREVLLSGRSLDDAVVKMKILLMAGFLLAANSVWAWNWQDPESKFDVTKNETMPVRLKWVVVKDINSACNAENKKRGGKPFGFSVQACSYWDGKECVILTSRMASIHNLGHEVLHCFRGSYH